MKQRFLSFHIPYLAPLLLIAGCQSPPAKLYVAESSSSPGDMIMRTHSCMSQFHVQEAWLPEGYCTVDFFVVIENQTDMELLTGKEEFSNGYNSLELLLRTEEGKVYKLEKTEGSWFRNLPEYVIIPPHGRLCWPVSLESSHWRGMPKLRPTIEDYLSSSEAMVEDDGSFILPDEILESISRRVDIQVKAIFHGLRDASLSDLRGPIESDWTSIMFGGIRSRVCLPTRHQHFKVGNRSNVFFADGELAESCANFRASTNSVERFILAQGIARLVTHKIDHEGVVVSCGMVREALGMPDYGKGKDDCFLEYVFLKAEDGNDYCLRFEAPSPHKIKYARVYMKDTDHLGSQAPSDNDAIVSP